MENYYKILGVSPEASESEIKKAYRALAKKYHPDTSGPQKLPRSKEKFKRLNEAYNTLRNREQRKKYDVYVLKRRPGEVKSDGERRANKALEHYKQGRKYYRDKNFPLASRQFQTAVNLENDNPLYCSWLGLSLSNMPRKLQEAKKWCEKAIELSPYEPDYYINLAIIYKEAGAANMSERFLRKALAVDPHNSRAKSWLAKTGEKPSIKTVFRNIISRRK